MPNETVRGRVYPLIFPSRNPTPSATSTDDRGLLSHIGLEVGLERHELVLCRGRGLRDLVGGCAQRIRDLAARVCGLILRKVAHGLRELRDITPQCLEILAV